MPAQPFPATDSAAELHKLIGDDATATFENDPTFVESNPTSSASSENLEEQRPGAGQEFQAAAAKSVNGAGPDADEEEDDLEDDDDLEDEDDDLDDDDDDVEDGDEDDLDDDEEEDDEEYEDDDEEDGEGGGGAGARDARLPRFQPPNSPHSQPHQGPHDTRRLAPESRGTGLPSVLRRPQETLPSRARGDPRAPFDRRAGGPRQGTGTGAR